jgi:hypothetical protein
MRYEDLVAVVVAPFVARRLAAEGWSKDDVRRALYKEARVPVPAWQQWWLRTTAPEWPGWIRDAEGSGSLPVVREPGDITVVVAGADLAIPQLAYFPSWGFPRCRVTREIMPAADG